MKLYLLRPVGYTVHNDTVPKDSIWDPWYDKAFGFVISASSPNEARALAHARGGDENRSLLNPWLDPKQSTCTILKPTKESQIIIRDFAAA